MGYPLRLSGWYLIKALLMDITTDIPDII